MGIIPPHLDPLPRGERKIKVSNFFMGTKGDLFFLCLWDDALSYSEVLEIPLVEGNDILRAGGLRNSGFSSAFER